MERGIQKRRVLINAIMSVVQVVIAGGSLFVLYRFLLNTVGVERLGIWSVVLATTSVANIANLGLSASVVKFVAKYLARGEEKTVASVIQTSAISLGILVGLILLISYPFANWLLSLVVPSTGLKEALLILPYALASFWITLISSVFQAGLDGCQRIDVRSGILIVSSLFNLILSFLLVPTHGLMGLAYAQVFQATVVLTASWAMLKHNLPLLPVFPYKWNRKIFKEIVGYSFNFQVISISDMFCDPTTKALLIKFGGLTMVGFYEMANRMVQQFRMLLVSADQVLVPAIADMQERKPDIIQSIYKENYRLIFYTAFPIYTVIIAMAPSISRIWIGHYEAVFIFFAILLAINSFINTLSVPAYFSYLGIGKLKWNTLGHVMTAVMNVILGFVAGYFWGGKGVIVGWVSSSIIGSLIIVISYHYKYKIALKEILPKESTNIAIACLIATLSAFLIYYRFSNNSITIIIFIATILAFSLIVFVPLWLHPIRKRLFVLINGELLNKNSGVN